MANDTAGSPDASAGTTPETAHRAVTPQSVAHHTPHEPGDPTRVLLVTKGHPFDRDAFLAVFEANDAITWRHVEHPDAQTELHPDRLGDIDVVVFYDMPGITFTGGEPPARFAEPPAEVIAGFAAMQQAGQPMVFLHHAIAGWPAWEAYARMIGGRFHYQPATLGGRRWPDSGYRHEVTHRVELLDPAHPLCAGLPLSFEITDELYCFPVFEDDVVPLMRSNHDFSADGFWSADRAIRGERNVRDGWTHPSGSSLVAWVKHAGRAPLAYVQFGDSPGTYADANYRRVLANAIAWAASVDAATWAAGRSEEGTP